MKLVRENIEIGFKRGIDPKDAMDVGYRALVKEWFAKYALNAEYRFEGVNKVIVEGDLDCSYNKLTSLPQGLVVEGNLDCRNNNLTSLPDDLQLDSGEIYKDF